jgi:ribosomal protein S18 acetylase RimI-like enzyme
MVEIREITDEEELGRSVPIIRQAFSTVAAEFNITQENNPTHASFITLERLLERGQRARFFGLYANNLQAGFVAIEEGPEGTYYMEWLAVPPGLRHRGYGRQLVIFVLDYVKKNCGTRVSLGMIDGHTILKEWYKSLGFVQTGTKKFERLPFLVCFMEKAVSAEQIE